MSKSEDLRDVAERRLEMRLKRAEEVVMMARQVTAYAWWDAFDLSDATKRDLVELHVAVWLYDSHDWEAQS